MNWAKTQYQELQTQRRHELEYQNIDTTLGEYLPMAAIIEKQGYAVDPEGATKRGELMCSKLARMGGKWLFFNELTDDWEFLFIKRQHIQTFNEKWAHYEIETDKKIKSGAGKRQATTEGEPEQKQKQAKKGIEPRPKGHRIKLGDGCQGEGPARESDGGGRCRHRQHPVWM